LKPGKISWLPQRDRPRGKISGGTLAAGFFMLIVDLWAKLSSDPEGIVVHSIAFGVTRDGLHTSDGQTVVVS
jgi:hypothetical protein